MCRHAKKNIEIKDGMFGKKFVHCWQCGLDGPIADDEETAMIVWKQFVTQTVIPKRSTSLRELDEIVDYWHSMPRGSGYYVEDSLVTLHAG